MAGGERSASLLLRGILVGAVLNFHGSNGIRGYVVGAKGMVYYDPLERGAGGENGRWSQGAGGAGTAMPHLLAADIRIYPTGWLYDRGRAGSDAGVLCAVAGAQLFGTFARSAGKISLLSLD